MKEYKCTKVVLAEQMGRAKAESLGLVRDVTGVEEEGYVVVYNEDYTSWTPKAPFEAGYEET